MAGKKFDQEKPMMDLLEPGFLFGMADTLTFGAKKYGMNNWKEGIKPERLYAAIQRHLNTYWDGEIIDDESGRNHLFHAAVDLMMLWWMTERQNK